MKFLSVKKLFAFIILSSSLCVTSSFAWWPHHHFDPFAGPRMVFGLGMAALAVTAVASIAAANQAPRTVYVNSAPPPPSSVTKTCWNSRGYHICKVVRHYN